MTNDKNNASKRTKAQVKSILKSNGFNFEVINLGDNRTFLISIPNTIQNKMKLKLMGFVLLREYEVNNSITVKTW